MRACRAFSFALLLVPLSTAFASSFTGITVFGDSLSDNGNVYIATLGLLPGSNYGFYSFAGTSLTTQYFSDGPNTTPAAAGAPGLWIDQLAGKLHLTDPQPVLAGGTNYAVGDAQTGTANPQDLGRQVALFSATHPGGASPTDLYTFWAGANDLFNGADPRQTADTISSYIAALHGQGADDFLWLNLPLLGDTPDGAPAKAALNAASLLFNDQWARDLAALQGAGIHVTGVDIAHLFTGIIANPGAYGLSNVTASAQGQNLTTDAGFLFWDGLHPTTQGHALVANDAFAALTPTPEPASLALLLCGAAAIGVIRNRTVRRKRG